MFKLTPQQKSHLRWGFGRSIVLTTAIVAVAGIIFNTASAATTAIMLIGIVAFYAVIRFAVNAIKLAQIKKYPAQSPGFELLVISAILAGVSLGSAIGTFIASLFN
jgi:Flp pilus assembly protein TadB